MQIFFALTILSMTQISCEDEIIDGSFRSEYVQKTMEILKTNRAISKKQEPKLISLLEEIYTYLLPTHKNTLALFTALAIHKTDYFRSFKRETKDFYVDCCPRGLLGLSGQPEYEKFYEFSGVDVLTKPNLLESSDKDMVSKTVEYFKYCMADKYTFKNLINCFNSEENVLYNRLKYSSLDRMPLHYLYSKLKDAF